MSKLAVQPLSALLATASGRPRLHAHPARGSLDNFMVIVLGSPTGLPPLITGCNGRLFVRRESVCS